MKKLLALLLLAPGMLAAQSPFDGTWLGKTDTAKFPQKPEQYVLDKSMYRCSTCVPKMDIKADGQDQKVAGSNYFNTRSVKVVDDHTVEFTDKKDGKTIYTETDNFFSSCSSCLVSALMQLLPDRLCPYITLFFSLN